MLEIIRSTLFLDVEFLWRDELGQCGYIMRNMMMNRKKDVASELAGNETAYQNKVQKLIEGLAALQ